MRRILGLLCMLLTGTPLQPYGEPTTRHVISPQSDDPYHIRFVSSAFQYYKSVTKARRMIRTDAMRFTQMSPSLVQLGDAVSIAMLKNCELDEIEEPENTDAYLNLVRISFSDPNKIVEKSDRSPRVSTLVLQYLQQKEMHDAGLEKRISYLLGCTKSLSCSTRAEAEFIRDH